MTESPCPLPSGRRQEDERPRCRGAVRRLGLATAAFLSLGLSGCGTVNVAVPDPVVIDVNMNVDVTTRSDERQTQRQTEELSAALDRRKRMAEVQGLKNDRIIGEDREGYLEVVRPPANQQYAEYAKKIVEAENSDRAVIYLAAAQKEGKPMEMIQSQYANLWRDRAFPGEWIQRDDGTWVQK